MQTIEIQVEDKLFTNIQKQGIDLKAKINDFLYDLVDDGYPAINTKEAKKRVSEAVKKYQSGKMETVSHEEMWAEIDKDIEAKSASSL